MARPRKEGLDYFPLDVDIDQDDKVALVEAQHGITGFAVVIKLLMRIYKDGYFYEWGEKEQLLFARLVNVDINSVNEIINDCLRWGLFDKKTFDEHQVLTSKGVQKRYLEATARRNNTTIINEYTLLSSQEVNDYINGHRKIVIVNKNGDTVEVLENSNTQSKVKESKVKESKVNNNTPPNNGGGNASDLIKYFHDRYVERFDVKPLIHGGKQGNQLKNLLKTYAFDDIKKYMDMYLGDDKDTFVRNAGHSLDGFFTKVQKYAVMQKARDKPKNETREEMRLRLLKEAAGNTKLVL